MSAPRERTKRTREVTLADRAQGDSSLLLVVLGKRPKYAPYLFIRETGQDGRVLASVTHARALRALAHRILRALGDER